MPTKKPRAQRLESASARRKLPISKKPLYVKIAPNIRLGYRRNEGPGTWNVRVTGPGIDWVKRIGLADDHEPADGRAVMSFWQAQDAARKLARRQPGDDVADDGRPQTVGEALNAYEADLAAKAGDVYNARRARIHLPASILTKPVGLLRSTELSRWRDGLIEQGLARSTVNRIRNCVRATLTLAARRDKRITNRHVWEDDLEALPNATQAKNIILSDDVVGKLITTTYEHDRKLGLLAQVIGETAARPSQVVRLEVADLDAKASRLMVPKSAKGHAHKRAAKMAEREPVPISERLTALLKVEAKGRGPHAPLLTRKNGEPWGYRRNDQYRPDFAKVVTAVGLDASVTLYALRHSAISRMLLRGVPVTLVARLSDTSEAVIRRHYAKLIAHRADEIARKGLLQLEPPSGDTVVALPERRPS